VKSVGILQIRRARPAELDVLSRVLGQRRLLADRLVRQSAGQGMLLVAWRGPRPIGTIYLWLEEAEEKELREYLPDTPILNHLVVRPDHRGGGIGTTLINAAERRLRMLGFHRVALAVEVSNRRATRLYSRLGYTEWPHSTVECYALTDGCGRAIEICRILVKQLRGQAEVEARSR
jgi:GNAT superfamily N-acetyltransferase